MKITEYKNVIPFIGYMKVDPKGIVRYHFADLDSRDSGTRKLATVDLIVSDPALYKALHKMTGANNELENLQVYFQYIDIKYPTYSYY